MKRRWLFLKQERPYSFPTSDSPWYREYANLRTIPNEIFEAAEARLTSGNVRHPRKHLHEILKIVSDNLSETRFQILAIRKCVEILIAPRQIGQLVLHPHLAGAKWYCRISHWRICWDLIHLGDCEKVVWRKIGRREKVYGMRGQSR